MSQRHIKYIHFSEAEEPVRPGQYRDRALQTLYPVADRARISPTGDRYSLALAAAGFQAGRKNHVYVVLTPALRPGEADVSSFQLESWQVYVNVGLPVENWPADDTPGQHGTLIRAATQALEALCEREGLDGSMIPDVERRVLEKWDELELVRLQKETKSYRVTVSYRLLPYGTPSPVFLEYLDRKTQQRGKIEFLRLSYLDDIFSLFASAAVTGGTIVLSPRNSFRASVITESYETPFRIPVHRVLQGMPGW